MKYVVILASALCCASLSIAGTIHLRNNPALQSYRAIATNTDANIKWSTITSNMVDVGTAIDAVGTELDAIDLASVTNSVFTGDQKTAIINLKNVLQSLKGADKDLKVASKNLMQATHKIVKKMQQTENAIKSAAH